MSSELAWLAERRAALAEKAESQRNELAQAMEPWRNPLALADRGVAGFRYVAQHKTLAAAVLGVAVALRPRLTWGLLRKGWLVWRIVQKARRILNNR